MINRQYNDFNRLEKRLHFLNAKIVERVDFSLLKLKDYSKNFGRMYLKPVDISI